MTGHNKTTFVVENGKAINAASTKQEARKQPVTAKKQKANGKPYVKHKLSVKDVKTPSQPEQPEAASLTKNQKARLKKQKAIKFLSEHWPKLFFVEHDQVLPLKIGIMEDLSADEKCSKSMLKQALGIYTSRQIYLLSVSRGGYRYDKEGKVSGAVQEKDKIYSKKIIQKRLNSIKQRKEKQQRKASDNREVKEKKQPVT